MLASLAAFPLVANALGLGGIRVDSALNEPLDARIELRSTSAAEVRDLAVRLGSSEAFSRAGIDRASVLMHLQFDVEETGKNRYVVRVRSEEPIREPYLNFLLDAEWPQGRMLREYTVLLDPPSLRDEPQGAPVETPSVEPPTRIARETPQRELAERPTRTAPPREAPPPERRVERVQSADRVPAAEPDRAAKPAEPARVATVAAPWPPSPEERFPRIPIDESPRTPNSIEVKESDTAWALARQVRPEGVTVQQVLMALVKSNPHAFEDGNVNRLKAGEVLRIDDPALLTAMSREEAVQAIGAQNSAWEQYKQRLAAAEPEKQTVMAGTRDQNDSAHRENARAELTLVSASGENSSAGTLASLEEVSEIDDVERLREELTRAVEAAETERSRNRELDDRLKELEEQLDSMQRLISLQDDELAALQQQLATEREEAAGEQAAVTGQQAPGAEASLETGEVESPESGANPVEAPTPDTEAAAPPSEAAVPPQTASGAANEMSEPAPSEPDASAGQAPAAEPAPTPVQVATPWWQAALAGAVGALALIASSPLLIAAAITVVVLLMLSLLLVVRRRRKLDSQFQESILAGMDHEPTDADAGESSFLSDFAVSGMGDVEAQDAEVDPLTEADVYMAYARYQQAEELLAQALEKEPDRTDLQLKMLEVYHASKNEKAFVELAGTLKARIGEGDPQWQRVLSMGREIAPAAALFAGAAAGAAAAQDPAMGEDDVLDIGLDTGIFDVDDLAGDDSATQDAQQASAAAGIGLDASVEAASSAEDSGLDLGLDFDTQGSSGDGLAGAPIGDTAAGDESGASAGEDLGLDLDFDAGDLPTMSATQEGSGAAESLDEGNALEFDVTDELGADLGAPQETPSTTADSDNLLDFDLGEFGTGDEQPQASASSSDAASGTSENMLDFDLSELGELNFEEEDATSAGSAAADSGPAHEDGAFPDDMDEIGTKLDLARAYIDMGDPDGARSILDEVVSEGNDHQQQEAQELLQQIA